MMKNLTFIFLLFSAIGSAQNSTFTVSKDKGLTQFVVQEVPGTSASELYKKSLEWINKTYKNPSEVILAKIENDYVRFEGYQQNLFCFSALGAKNCNDVKYQIELGFKDGKYKFTITSLADYIKPSQYMNAGWRPSELSTFGSNCYKNNGEIKSMCKDYVVDVPVYFTKLNESLNNYISRGDNKNDW